jgi:hypothetical protein
MSFCQTCGVRFTYTKADRRGRLREFCDGCSQPGADDRRWRAAHPDKVQAYNTSRRKA